MSLPSGLRSANGVQLANVVIVCRCWRSSLDGSARLRRSTRGGPADVAAFSSDEAWLHTPLGWCLTD
jgi:hypothetical protein